MQYARGGQRKVTPPHFSRLDIAALITFFYIMHVCVCVHTCARVCICACVCVHVFLGLCMRAHARVHVCPCACVLMCAHACVCICARALLWTLTNLYNIFKRQMEIPRCLFAWGPSERGFFICSRCCNVIRCRISHAKAASLCSLGQVYLLLML